MQRRVILVVSETAVSVASVEKLFYKKKQRNILCQTVAKRVQESKNLRSKNQLEKSKNRKIEKSAFSTYKFYFIATKPGKLRLKIILFEVV